MKKFYILLFLAIFFYNTSDIYCQWEEKRVGIFDLYCSEFIDDNTGFVGGFDAIYKTTDAANTWDVKYQLPWNAGIKDIAFIENTRLGYAVGYDGNEHPLVLQSTNSGNIWQRVYISANRDVGAFSTILYQDGYLFVIGMNRTNSVFHGIILFSSNNGETWKESWCPLISGMGKASIHNNELYIPGDHGCWKMPLLDIRQSNNNRRWENIGPENMMCMDVVFRGQQILIAGQPTTAYKLPNTPWQMQSLSGWNCRIIFPSETKLQAFTAGRYGLLYQTTNEGLTWREMYRSQSGESISDISYPGKYTYFVGDDGLVIKQNNALVTSLLNQEKVISDFNLSQNFPNPFNPTTRIAYTIATPGLVSLKIYNSLGKEIVILVNEQKSPGSYVVDFDGTKLPSGVYFYRLQTISHVDQKIMILVK